MWVESYVPFVFMDLYLLEKNLFVHNIFIELTNTNKLKTNALSNKYTQYSDFQHNTPVHRGGYYTPIRNLIYTTLIINILQTPLLYKICEKNLIYAYFSWNFV